MSLDILGNYLSWLEYSDIMAFSGAAYRLNKVIVNLPATYWRAKVLAEFPDSIDSAKVSNIHWNWRRVYQYLCEPAPLTAMAKNNNLHFLEEYSNLDTFEYEVADFYGAVNIQIAKPRNNIIYFRNLLEVSKSCVIDPINVFGITNRCLDSFKIDYAVITFQVFGATAYSEFQSIDLVHTAFLHRSTNVKSLLQLIEIIGPQYANGWIYLFLECRLDAYLVPKAAEMIAQGYIDPGAFKSSVFRQAVQLGAIALVKLLLKDPRTHPAESKNYAVRRAAENGYVDILKLLIKSGKVNIHTQNDLPINLATMHGQSAIVKLLIESGVSRKAITPSSVEYYQRYQTNI